MSPVVVTGVHRSGTSLVARMLQSAGLYLGEDGDLLDAAPDNPEGFFEHRGFVRLDDDLLEATGGAWDHPPACGPMAADDPRVESLREEATLLVAGLAAHDPWGWKDPRTSLTARFWLDLVPNIRFVVCLRHPLEVALSLKQRNQASYHHALNLWHAYYTALVDTVPEERRIVTHYDAHFGPEVTETERLLDFVGLPGDAVARSRDALRPHLRHHRLDVTLAEAGVTPATIDLYRRLREEAGRPPERELPPYSPARVSRATLDLARANHELERQRRQVTSIERQRADLEARVAQLEAAGNDSLLGQVHGRIDVLEDAIHQVRYQLEDLTGRLDQDVVRGCRELVRSHVARDEEVVVVAKGDPALLDLYGRPTATFPQDALGRYPGFALADSTAAIAHLEALRMGGARFFLLPETSAWWIDHFSAFTEHLIGRYELVDDQAGAGLLVNLQARTELVDGWSRALSDVIDRLGSACGSPPSVLDWTDLDLPPHLPGYNVFVPPRGGDDRLPYFDDTVDIVAIDRPLRLDDASRVGRLAVVCVSEAGVPCPVVETVRVLAPALPSAVDLRLVVVVPSIDPDPTWIARLHEALGDESAEILLAPGPDVLGAAAARADLVALIDDGVLPMPGCVGAARRTLVMSDGAGAVATKLFGPDGSLEAAGTVVFADGSSCGVAAGSFDVAAPWHEFVRQTCTGRGLTVFTAGAIGRIDPDVLTTLEAPAWCARLWEVGLAVVYQPDAAAVRARPLRQPTQPDRESETAWSSSSQGRPVRPPVLNEVAWRRMMATENAAARQW